jgi:AcrR family transcriptional regulator
MRSAGQRSLIAEFPGRRERRKEVTRRELLVAGRKLFSEKGLYDCRVEEITQLADIGKGTLYQYFGSKEELVFAVVRAGFLDLDRRAAERARGLERFEDIVMALVESHLDFFSENRDLLKIFHQVRGILKFNRPEWRPLRRILDGHLERLARELERDGSRRRLGHARARELANLIFGSVSGWLSVRVSTDPKASVATLPPGLVEALAVMARRFAAAGGTAGPRSAGRPKRKRSAPRPSGSDF